MVTDSYVWAKSGLNIRTAPNLKSEKIGKNGVIIESEGSTGWHYNQIIMPGFSLKHGLLIFLAGTSFEEEYQNDKFQGIERIRLLKKTKPELEFFFGGPDGHYKLLQLGHTLIIEISNGC